MLLLEDAHCLDLSLLLLMEMSQLAVERRLERSVLLVRLLLLLLVLLLILLLRSRDESGANVDGCRKHGL